MKAVEKKMMTEAKNKYTTAAKQGHDRAQRILGVMYAEGQGVAQNHKEVARWDRKAADQGNANAQSILGTLYRTGEGVAQDYKEAVC